MVVFVGQLDKDGPDHLSGLNLNRQRLADQISAVLREQILVEKFPAGSPIHERETAEAIGVSRTPLREALFILEAEGLVDMSPAKSPIVSNPTLEEISELAMVQSALEALAGEMACKTASDDEIQDILDIHAALMAYPDDADPIEFFRVDMSFHEAIVQASGNSALVKTHRQYNTRLWRARYQASSRAIRRQNTLKEHGMIADALQRRDAKSVSTKLRTHIRNVTTNLQRLDKAEQTFPTSKA